MKSRFVFLRCLAAAAAWLAHGSAEASPVTFTLDPAQSRISLSGNAAGNPLVQQGPGSLVTSMAGTINADVTATTIRFTGGSAIDAQTNGVWEPGPGGTPDRAPADYGAQASSFIGTLKGALRNIVMDLTSGTLTVSSSNGTFDPSVLVFSFPTNGSAALDFDAGFAGSGSESLGGYATNRTVTGATLATQGGVQTLIIEIDTEFKFGIVADGDSAVRLRGQLLARSTPASLAARFEGITLTNQTVRLVVADASPQAQLESSPDLTAWSPRSATTTTESGKTVYVTPVMAPHEFFRVKN